MCTDFTSIDEEEDMTFQIGFSTPECVLLASDLKNVNQMGFRWGISAPKIKVHESENLAYCSAGDDFCNVFTETIREEIRKNTLRFVQGEVEDAIMQCVYAARERESVFCEKHTLRSHRRVIPTCIGGTTMLVFRRNGIVTLWIVETSLVVPTIMPVSIGWALAGDKSNPAVYFPHWYFDKLPKTPDSLIPLAVHTILMAKNDNVEGIQIGVFTKDRFRVLTSEELKPYITLSDEIDSDILKRLQTVPEKGADTF